MNIAACSCFPVSFPANRECQQATTKNFRQQKRGTTSFTGYQPQARAALNARRQTYQRNTDNLLGGISFFWVREVYQRANDEAKGYQTHQREIKQTRQELGNQNGRRCRWFPPQEPLFIETDPMPPWYGSMEGRGDHAPDKCANKGSKTVVSCRL